MQIYELQSIYIPKLLFNATIKMCDKIKPSKGKQNKTPGNVE